MMKPIQTYLDQIKKEHATGRAREHAYRPALKELLKSLNDKMLATNDPAREDCGAPDFIITDRQNIPRGYIETKDIIPNILDDEKNQKQIKNTSMEDSATTSSTQIISNFDFIEMMSLSRQSRWLTCKTIPSHLFQRTLSGAKNFSKIFSLFMGKRSKAQKDSQA